MHLRASQATVYLRAMKRISAEKRACTRQRVHTSLFSLLAVSSLSGHVWVYRSCKIVGEPTGILDMLARGVLDVLVHSCAVAFHVAPSLKVLLVVVDVLAEGASALLLCSWG